MSAYCSTIKMDKVKIAQAKVDEAKGLMHSNVIEMSNNVANVRDKLLPTTQELAMEARKF